MTRQNPTFDTLRALFAKSGNRCAFPGCTSVLVNNHNLFIGQVCHIEAASPEGPRFNASQSIQQRRSYDNLILLCYPHHIEVDHDAATYPSSRLKEFKIQHELSIDKPYAVDNKLVNQLALDMEIYWQKVEHANKHEHPAPEFAVDIDTQADYSSLSESVSNLLRDLDDALSYLSSLDRTLNDEILAHLRKLGYDTASYEAVPYYENPFFNRAWETHSLAVRNLFTKLHMLFSQMDIKYLELHLATHPDDQPARDKLSRLRNEFLESARSAGLAD